MARKPAIFGAIGVVAAVLLAVSLSAVPGDPPAEPMSFVMQGVLESDVTAGGDVVMPTKVSRPGCEEADRCYVPSIITVASGESVTWVNEDSAFHSVTSGTYDDPESLFDSGYMDPFDSYTLTFDDVGTYDYFCTLHPWMEGRVMVE